MKVVHTADFQLVLTSTSSKIPDTQSQQSLLELILDLIFSKENCTKQPDICLVGTLRSSCHRQQRDSIEEICSINSNEAILVQFIASVLHTNGTFPSLKVDN